MQSTDTKIHTILIHKQKHKEHDEVKKKGK